MLELLVAIAGSIYIPICSKSENDAFPSDLVIRRIAISPSTSEYYIPIQDLTHTPKLSKNDLHIHMITRPCFTYKLMTLSDIDFFNPRPRYIPAHYSVGWEISIPDPLIPPPFQK